MLFSSAVLFALFMAIPCGLIMREPLSATISTAFGAIFFTSFVIYSFKKGIIAKARIILSFILIFVFLPAMYFTNGGTESGAPIWLLLGTFYIAMILDGKFKAIMIGCEAIVLIICWLVGYYFPGLVTVYSRGGNAFDTIAALFIVSCVTYMITAFSNRLMSREEEHQNIQRLFAQTATALVNAIDAKDKYTHGHSSRVAEYSKRIAEELGKSPAECEEIYYVALLHDVGKIGVPESIINKEGRLTKEEYEVIKQHPVMGAQILQSISEFPYIGIAAQFHHERYDGKGYPWGMKGSDIPEIARIVGVADAYDAMTSKRSYRDPLPQEKVREEFIEGSGAQFDPEFANIMLHLIDLDEEYDMKERLERKDLSEKDALVIGEHRSEVSDGIMITPAMTTISLEVSVDKKATGHVARPSLVLFDSLDGRFHDEEKEIEDLLYFEYCEIFYDGRVANAGARKTAVTNEGSREADKSFALYTIEAVRIRDHALIRIIGRNKKSEIIVALPDSTRYLYIGLTGEHCRISDVTIDKSEEEVAPDYIPRIAEEISYINVPAGDVPNVQVDGYRSESTAGIPVRDGMSITFHSKNLPTARLVWHCPSYVIFAADDGKVYGENYTEFSLVRIDGETWEAGHVADNELVVNKPDFAGWDAWKEFNKQGYECTVSFKRDGNRIESTTTNNGIEIRNVTTINVEAKEIYVALSGDQCALTNIRINNG